MGRWHLNEAIRVVILDEMNKQTPLAIEETRRGPQVETLVKELATDLNNLRRVSVVMALAPEPMPLDIAKSLLSRQIAAMLDADNSGRPKDFWLMWEIKHKENMSEKELFKAPSMHELKRASVTFKRFFINKEISKTDNYLESIDIILSSTDGVQNLYKDLSYLVYMSKGEP